MTSVEQNGRKWLVLKEVSGVVNLGWPKYCGSVWQSREDYEIAFPSLPVSDWAMVPEKKLLHHLDEYQCLEHCNRCWPPIMPSYASCLKENTRDPTVGNQAKQKSPGQRKRDRDRQQLKRQAKRAAKKTCENLVYEGGLAAEDMKDSSKEILVEWKEEEEPLHDGQCQVRAAEYSGEITLPLPIRASKTSKLDYRDEHLLRILSMFSRLHNYTISELVSILCESGSATRPMVGKTQHYIILVPLGWQSQLEPYALGAVYAIMPLLDAIDLGSTPFIEGRGLVVDRRRGYVLIMKHTRACVPLVGYCALFRNLVCWQYQLNQEDRRLTPKC